MVRPAKAKSNQCPPSEVAAASAGWVSLLTTVLAFVLLALVVLALVDFAFEVLAVLALVDLGVAASTADRVH